MRLSDLHGVQRYPQVPVPALFTTPTELLSDSSSESDDESIPEPEQARSIQPFTLKAVSKMSACLSPPRLANGILLKLLTQVSHSDATHRAVPL